MVFEDKKDVQGVSAEGKKPYSKPKLEVYGDLASITRAKDAGHPLSDGGTSGLTKT
jgi:hypothetical protein